jgi:hypothetical protein
MVADVFYTLVQLECIKEVSWVCAREADSRYCFPASCFKINFWHDNMIRRQDWFNPTMSASLAISIAKYGSEEHFIEQGTNER